jgi:hypothetical protein
LSVGQDKVRSIAERIASRLGASDAGGVTKESAGGGELAQLRASLRDLQQRLVQIESRVAGDGAGSSQAATTGASAVSGAGSATQAQGDARQRTPQQFLSSTYVPATHPSQERFGVADAVAELVDYFESEKTCTVEPGGKPCDHCAMCSSRGF